jgi:flagellar hook-basal body complex protein FliE
MMEKPVLAPVPVPKISAWYPDFRPKVFNEEFYNATGNGIDALGKITGANGVSGDGNFDSAMLKALDKVNAYQQNYEGLYEQMIVDPDSVDIHEITQAQANASMSLNVARTVLNRVVQAWKDIINTR